MQVLITLTLTALVLARTQEEQPAGAKALFGHSATGATILVTSGSPSATASSSSRTSRAMTKSPAAAPAMAAQQAVANTGLMYYVELLESSGEVHRVTTNHGFRSGQRIRLHFLSNQDGRVVLVQHEPGGSARVLFPDQRISDGANHIRAGIDTVLPSEAAWFRFDDNPGVERLTVFLAPDGSTAEAAEPAIAGMRTALSCDPEGGGVGQKALILDIANQPVLSNRQTNELTGCLDRLRGSKALLVELDSQSPAPATYIVRTSSTGSKQGLVATEILLNHTR